MPNETNEQPRNDTAALMQYDANKKSNIVAYLLLIFLGGLGLHRFYAGATVSGLLMLGLFIVSWLLAFVAVGFVGFIILGIWWFIDLFLLHGIIAKSNSKLAESLTD